MLMQVSCERFSFILIMHYISGSAIYWWSRKLVELQWPKFSSFTERSFSEIRRLVGTGHFTIISIYEVGGYHYLLYFHALMHRV